MCATLKVAHLEAGPAPACRCCRHICSASAQVNMAQPRRKATHPRAAGPNPITTMAKPGAKVAKQYP